MSLLRALAVGLALAAAAPVRAEAPASVVGAWRLAAGPDVAGALILSEDGRFQYWLSAGALDERAEGRWTDREGHLRLDTVPRPVPPRFSAALPSGRSTGPFMLRVAWPDGRGIAGIDFRVGLDGAEPLNGYTQEDGATLPEAEGRAPLWVELREPIHGIASPRFPVDPAASRVLNFVLTPNDLGIADFDGARLDRDGDRLILHQRLGALTFVRTATAGRPPEEK